MAYWLMKSEPDTYGIEALQAQRKQTDHWDGIRNYQVRNMIRDEMKVGDQAFFYHSNCKPPGIVGRIEIVKSAYPDFTAFDPAAKYYDPKSDPDNPRWFMVDVKLLECFPRLISLDELRTQEALSEMLVLRKGSRLSITPVSPQEWKAVLALAQ